MGKIESQESGLRAIYKSVFDVLENADRSQFSDIQKANLPVLDSSLDSPEAITFDKLVAVLKAVLSSQNKDRIQLECYYGILSTESRSVGRMISEGLRALGLGLGDLQSFAKEKGWIGE
jgi:hypothetical protein